MDDWLLGDWEEAGVLTGVLSDVGDGLLGDWEEAGGLTGVLSDVDDMSVQGEL